jgi:hypothetical protein
LAGVCVVAALSPVGEDDGQVLCPFRLATGGWCPGCGGTRAVRSFVRADVATALTLNPWAVLVMAQAAVITGWVAAAPDAAMIFWNRWSQQFLIGNIVLALAIWGVRLSVGAIPLPF